MLQCVSTDYIYLPLFTYPCEKWCTALLPCISELSVIFVTNVYERGPTRKGMTLSTLLSERKRNFLPTLLKMFFLSPLLFQYIYFYRAELVFVFRIVPAIERTLSGIKYSDFLYFLLQILHLGCIYIKQVLA